MYVYQAVKRKQERKIKVMILLCLTGLILFFLEEPKAEYGIKKELLRMLYQETVENYMPLLGYFEASQEGNVPDLFLKLRRIEDKNDENYFFIEQVKKASEEIIKIIQGNKEVR